MVLPYKYQVSSHFILECISLLGNVYWWSAIYQWFLSTVQFWYCPISIKYNLTSSQNVSVCLAMCIDDQLPTNDFLFPLNLCIASSVSSIILDPLRTYQYAWQCVLMTSYLPMKFHFHSILVPPHQYQV